MKITTIIISFLLLSSLIYNIKSCVTNKIAKGQVKELKKLNSEMSTALKKYKTRLEKIEPGLKRLKAIFKYLEQTVKKAVTEWEKARKELYDSLNKIKAGHKKRMKKLEE